MEDIILQYTYPRLDAEVSKHRNHLLKAPFCIHPKTGRVCVPVDPERVDDFDPTTVPDVCTLLRELDEAGKMEVDQEDGETRGGKMMLPIMLVESILKKGYRLGADFPEALCRYAGPSCWRAYGRGAIVQAWKYENGWVSIFLYFRPN